MKLSKLYCNNKDVFPDIPFQDGLNVILGQIRDPKNRSKSTHNIGKTTFIKLVDFCLLKGISQYSFWRKNPEIFRDFTFYLELSYSDGYITISRSMGNDSKSSIKKHSEKNQDYSRGNVTWDHENITIDNAKEIIDGYLDIEIIKPWNYRKVTSYLLRTQEDYDDIFRLSKHIGKDIDWKPPLVKILGLNGELVENAYEIDDELDEIENKIAFIEKRVHEFKNDPDMLNGLIQINREDIKSFENKLQDFDFKEVEDDINKDLVDRIENEISDLNSRRYYLNLDVDSIESALERKNVFSLKKTEKVFKEVGVYFGEQVKKDYEDLLDFNRKITRERKKYLKLELESKKKELKRIEIELSTFNGKRIEAMSKIKERETFNKYKKLGDQLAEKKLNLLNLESIKDDLTLLEEEKDRLSNKKKDRAELTQEMKKILTNPPERYLSIKSSYNEIIKKVLNRTAIINTRVNSAGNYSFEAPFVDKDGISTSEDDGHTFKKLQCIAFDSSIVLNSINIKFPHFVIHDGVLETLENRTKLNLLEVFKEHTEKGVQEVITVLDSHLPTTEEGNYEFDENDVIRVLHDEGKEGRLFRMSSW